MDAATEFANRTQIDLTLEGEIDLVDGESVYDVFGDTGIEVSLIRQVFGPQGELRPRTLSQLEDSLPNWKDAAGQAPLYYRALTENSSIEVYPRPAESNGGKLRIVAAWRPSMGSMNFPDNLGMEFFRDIAEGAKSILLSMPDCKWTNLQMAGIAQGKFESAIVDARLKALHEGAAGTLTARPVRFGG